jgi:hypothetical protein
MARIVAGRLPDARETPKTLGPPHAGLARSSTSSALVDFYCARDLLGFSSF